MAKIKVGVIRGGSSSEYDISLKTGEEVLKNLPEKYKGADVLLGKEDEWHLGGFLETPDKVFDSVDVIFNALHGEFGEDGKVQQVFESFGVPYTGSQIIPSSLAMQKHLAREIFSRYGIKIPRALLFEGDVFFGIDAEECAKKVFNSTCPPWVVKPVSGGSSVGVSVCNSFSDLLEGMESASCYNGSVLVEEYIKGREAACGILEGYRNEQSYALPVVEIIPPENRFFDYQAKYDGSTREICPANFDNSTKIMIEEITKIAHQALGCRHYSRADFIVSPKGVYLLEINTLPGLTSESLLPKSAEAIGLSFPQLLDHVLQLALNK